MADRLLLIDGMNLLFQMFFGMPARIVGREGKPVQGVLGFAAATLKIIRMVNPTHVAVIFDGEHENARTLIDSEYKANRPDLSDVEDSENPFSQIDDVYRALDYMGLVHFETQTCEADDMIASYAMHYHDNAEIVVSSFDSDFFQLIQDGIKVLRYRGEHSIMCDDEYMSQKYGICGRQYVDHKSLTGDTADNIRGIDKIGPKTATKLLNQFGNLDEMLNRLDEIERSRLRESIESGIERLSLNRRLISMDCNVELPYDLESLVYECGELTARDVLKGIGLF